MNDGCPEQIQRNITLQCPHNIKIRQISDVKPATKTFEQRRNLVCNIEYLDDELGAYVLHDHSN